MDNASDHGVPTMNTVYRILVAAFVLASQPVCAEEVAAGALERLPVREVTVFKDGHAYVIHEGNLSVHADGAVRMDYLPNPILGAFWVYSTEARKPVRQVTASVQRVKIERTALTIPELISANVGADVTVQEITGKPYIGRIIGIPTRSSEELDRTSPPWSDPRLPERSSLVLIETRAGVLTVPMDRIQTVSFRNPPRSKAVQEEFRSQLTVSADGRKQGEKASIGLMYVQRGIRWIPSYRMDIDGNGTARVQLQATLINEMVDLKDATVHLVVGVPTFAFKDTIDPMALQQTFAQLSQYFRQDDRSGQILSNAVMTQTARMRELPSDADGRPGMPDVPEIAGDEKSEDLFVYRVANVTLKRGARMVVPVAEFTLPYEDIYTLTIGYGPPPEIHASLNTSQMAEISRMLAAPTVEHKLRLTNTSRFPLTTAPALVFINGKIQAQAMLTYTAVKARTDLPMTTAVDIRTSRSDTETARTPAALTVNDQKYGRTDILGKLTLTSYATKPVKIEVTRYVAGVVDTVGEEGKSVNVDIGDIDRIGAALPDWTRGFPWPWWWYRVNGLGRFTWTVTLEPGTSVDLTCRWRYFWQ